MKNFLYLIIAATIYFSLKEGFELKGFGWTIVCGAVAGSVVAGISWLIDNKIQKRKSNKKQK